MDEAVTQTDDGCAEKLNFTSATQLASAAELIGSVTRSQLEHALDGQRRGLKVYESLRSLNEIIGTQYGDRVLFELLQNAHDAHAAGEKGEVAIHLLVANDHTGMLLVANKGRPSPSRTSRRSATSERAIRKLAKGSETRASASEASRRSPTTSTSSPLALKCRRLSSTAIASGSRQRKRSQSSWRRLVLLRRWPLRSPATFRATWCPSPCANSRTRCAALPRLGTRRSSACLWLPRARSNWRRSRWPS